MSSIMTRILHHRAAQLAKGDPIALPITTATTFHLPGEHEGEHFYSRAGTPTVEALEAELSILEAAQVTSFPSGMAAVTAALMACVGEGDRLLIPSDGYYNTRRIAEEFLEPLGISVEACPTAKMASRDLLGFACVLVETPSNPGLDLCDLSAVATNAQAAGAKTIADNTTATPLGQQPLDHGIDISLSAGTKAIAGHSDVLAGHTATRDTDLADRMARWRTLSGSVPGAFDAFLVHRGLATLELRLERMQANALTLAEALEAKRHKVSYPGLASHPHHALAQTQMPGFGTLLGLDLGTAEAADAFLDNCPVLIPATSFGGVHSSAERRARWGDAVGEGYLRISCGVEPTHDFVSGVMDAL